FAIFESVFAVAGAIKNKSAQRANSTWLFHLGSLKLSLSFSSVNEENTSFLESVESVSGVTNSFADCVITTFTSAPFFTKSRTKKAALYAAIPPVTPSKIFFPFKTDISYVLVYSLQLKPNRLLTFNE